jgi:chromate transporter
LSSAAGIDRFSGAPWQAVLRAGVMPVSLGLIASSAAVVARAADHDWVTIAITLASVAILYLTRLNPLWVFAAAAVIAGVGLA